jgi:rod shape determining protein RodA
MMNWDQARRLIGRMNWGLLLAALLLMGLGVLFIYSAGYKGEDQPVAPFYRRQILWVGAGLAVYFMVLLFDYHRLGEASWWIYIMGVVLLVLVLATGKRVYGAVRWLDLFGMQVQPSELAKLATLLVLARYLSRPGREPAQPGTLLAVAVIVGIPFLLIIKEPDLGTAMVLVPMAVALLFVAGLPARSLLVLVAAGALLLPVGWFTLDDYQKNRILTFLDPGRDPLGAGWNKIQSEIAVGSGGLTGKGYLNGTQNVLGFLPRSVAPTDFIFSVIAEEMGFVGTALVMSLYAAVLTGILRAAMVARDKLGRLLSVGMGVVLFTHVFVNIAMTVGLMPITGLPLPLISYGGSFMLTVMAGLGMVQSIYVRRYRS